MLIKKLTLALSLVALTACGGRGDDDPTDSGDTDTSDTDTSDTDTSDTDTDPSGFAMSGTALDLRTLAPAAEGLCVYAADPSKAMGTGMGSDLDILGESQIGGSGQFIIENIVTTSTVGLFVIVQDCTDATEATVVPTATGVSPGNVASVSDGETLEGLTMLSINNQMATGIDMSLTGVGYEGGSVQETGMMAGFVRDNAAAPIAGATVSCTTGSGKPCAPVFYADDKPTPAEGGLFASANGINTGTAIEAGGLFVVPGAPVFTYSAAHDDYTFTDQIFGSATGLATFMTFFAE